ncbi:Ig-like domain repeat protein [Nakamurella silvestris]|nr:Ig-like domain repeat protein [Nakamurella silvestris]
MHRRIRRLLAAALIAVLPAAALAVPASAEPAPVTSHLSAKAKAISKDVTLTLTGPAAQWYGTKAPAMLVAHVSCDYLDLPSDNDCSDATIKVRFSLHGKTLQVVPMVNLRDPVGGGRAVFHVKSTATPGIKDIKAEVILDDWTSGFWTFSKGHDTHRIVIKQKRSTLSVDRTPVTQQYGKTRALITAKARWVTGEIPTGRVNFVVDGKTHTTVALDKDGIARFRLSSTAAVGTHRITVTTVPSTPSWTGQRKAVSIYVIR